LRNVITVSCLLTEVLSRDLSNTKLIARRCHNCIYRPTWGHRYVASGRTQQKTPPPTVSLNSFHGWLPSDSPDIIDVFTGRYQVIRFPTRDRCMAAVPHAKTKTKLRGLSPQANYTDRATAAVGEVVPAFADRGVLRGQHNGSPRPLISVF
jgi:hypothetical protein